MPIQMDFPKINVNLRKTMSDISNPDISSKQGAGEQDEHIFEKMKMDIQAQQKDSVVDVAGKGLKVSGSDARK